MDQVNLACGNKLAKRRVGCGARDIGHDRKVGSAGFHRDRRLAFGRLGPGVGKPQQNCDEPFDVVPDHEIGDGGDCRSFVLESEQRELAPKSGLPAQVLAQPRQRDMEKLGLAPR